MTAVRSPRILGRPMWSWAGALTTRYEDHPTERYANGYPKVRLKLRCRVARAVLWPLCKRITGHRMAEGERGYGGGGIDVICAYCYFPWTVPVEEMPSAGDLVELFHGMRP